MMNQEKKETGVNIDQAVLRLAGVMILVSVGLGIWWHEWALGLTVFIGLNMLQASVTGFCPAAEIFRKLGVRPGCAFGGK